jgi:hypothetical protein
MKGVHCRLAGKGGGVKWQGQEERLCHRMRQPFVEDSEREKGGTLYILSFVGAVREWLMGG